MIYLAVAGWVVGWAAFVYLMEPDDAASGALVLIAGLFIWPLFALGWLVSRRRT